MWTSVVWCMHERTWSSACNGYFPPEENLLFVRLQHTHNKVYNVPGRMSVRTCMVCGFTD